MAQRRHALEHRVPPPLVGLAVGALMAGLAQFGPALALPDSVRQGLTALLVVLGIGFDGAGLLAFRKARTTINPLKPAKASAMVTGGVYRFTRNPMYVGLVCFLCAWATYLWSGWALIGPLAFVGYISRFQIAPEEETLARLFGEGYLAYKAKVRRWL